MKQILSNEKVNLIELIPGYYLTADENQYILVKSGIKEKVDFKTRQKTGDTEEYKEIIGYYSTLRGLLDACLTNVLRTGIIVGKLDTLTKVIDEIERAEKLLSNATLGH